MPINPTYSPLIERAVRTAVRLHEGQTRKTDPDLPYVTHLFHVAFIVQAHGFPETAVAAALLHDALEDTEYTPEELAGDFGEDVCAIVMAVTERKGLRWEERKRLYLDTVAASGPEVKAVCAADKIHNLSTILDAYAERGEALWSTFRRGREKTLRFYVEALTAVSAGWSHPIIDAYRAVVERAEHLLGGAVCV